MNCEVCALDSSVDSVMWTCAACPRKFHAACVGVSTQPQIQRGSLRKNDKAVNILSYMLPCCSSCQLLVTATLEFKTLEEQQALLVKEINNNTEIVHRLTKKQEDTGEVSAAYEGLETLMTSIKNELAAINKTNSLAGSVTAIKNHVTTVFDIAFKSTNDKIAKSLKTVTTELAVDLRKINDSICQLNQQAIDAAATSTMTTNPVLELDILEELKSLSANIMASQNPAPSPVPSDPFPSLGIELNETNGWRLLGTRKVWKADWTDYDARSSRRLIQQKMADKAKKRRKTNKSRNNNIINNNNTNNSHSHIHRNNNNSMSTNHNNFWNNRNITHINHHDSNNNNNNNNNKNNTNSNNNNNSNNHDFNHFSNYSRNNFLPSDRELLAAAKDQFSRPSTNFRPTIQFQRGEVLNPYPVGDGIQRNSPGCSSATSCEACYCRRSCFLRN